MFRNLLAEIDSIIARDPAARSRLEVVLTYPGFHAVLLHRAAHALWGSGLRLLGRWLAAWARFFTGIEIHPGAKIGRRLFIDHGMGVVVGEAAEIGDDVTLYQGVTLGGIAPSVNARAQSGAKRHPTIDNNVIIGSGAQILGPVTVGECARVAANAVVVRDVAPRTTVVGIPARVVRTRDEAASDTLPFRPYGMPTDDLADPQARTLEAVLDEIARVKARLAQLEQEVSDGLRGNAPTHPDTDHDTNPVHRLEC